MTTQFEKIFGYQSLPSGLLCAPVTDLDMVVNNVMQGKQKKWVHLDYEWTFDFPIPVDFIIFRVLHYYILTSQRRLILKDYYDNYFTSSEIALFEEMEKHFQDYVKGDYVPMRDLYKQGIGKSAIQAVSLVDSHRKVIKIYKNLSS